MWIMYQLEIKIKFKMEPKDRTSTLLFHDDTHLGGDLLVMSQGKKNKQAQDLEIYNWRWNI